MILIYQNDKFEFISNNEYIIRGNLQRKVYKQR